MSQLLNSGRLPQSSLYCYEHQNIKLDVTFQKIFCPVCEKTFKKKVLTEKYALYKFHKYIIYYPKV